MRSAAESFLDQRLEEDWAGLTKPERGDGDLIVAATRLGTEARDGRLGAYGVSYQGAQNRDTLTIQGERSRGVSSPTRALTPASFGSDSGR